MNIRDYQKQYYLKNKEKIKQTRRKWYQENKIWANQSTKNWYLKNRDIQREVGIKIRYKRRLKILKFLGNKCIKCGFNDWRALQVDHVNGGGRKELKKYILKIIIKMFFEIKLVNINYYVRIVIG